jgi:hypothetical protein
MGKIYLLTTICASAVAFGQIQLFANNDEVFSEIYKTKLYENTAQMTETENILDQGFYNCSQCDSEEDEIFSESDDVIDDVDDEIIEEDGEYNSVAHTHGRLCKHAKVSDPEFLCDHYEEDGFDFFTNTEASEVISRLYREIGHTATLQYSTILSALIGNRKLRPQIAANISMLRESFSNMKSRLSSLVHFLEKIPDVWKVDDKLDKWINQNLGKKSATMRDYRIINNDFESFLVLMLYGNLEEVKLAMDNTFDAELGLVGKIKSFERFFDIESEYRDIWQIINEIKNPESRHVARYLFKEVHKAICKVIRTFFDYEETIRNIVDTSDELVFDDVATRIDSLEKKVNSITDFLSIGSCHSK